MSTPREKSPLDIYHIVNVGVAKQAIFVDKHDYEQFLERLNSDTFRECEVIAWCLMTNHFHLLVKGNQDCISIAMLGLLSSHTRNFNNRHGRTGPLFQSRYFSEPICSEKQLLCAIRYIHQNPEKAKIGKHETYQWSSYQDFFGTSISNSRKEILNLLGGRQKFAQFHRSEETANFLEENLEGKIGDSEALLILRELLRGEPLGNNALSDKWRRSIILRSMQRQGVSVKQMQRVTGLSLNQVRYSLYSNNFEEI